MTGLTPQDIHRMAKQGWQQAEGDMIKQDARDPLPGIAKQQNTRSRNIRDVINIGGGTRCRHCGMLHFCYIERCGACSKPMDYNLGKVEKVV
ncbi:MAG: hypothetical protein HOC79_00095 [Euryarchaeota archaeon]|jgi:hypothetical protein|nr:hypothetical protein [Euryarchaeota archaeon]